MTSAAVQSHFTMIHAKATWGCDVKRNKTLNPALPIHDYRPALQCAMSWLGDRYLLAEPARRVPEQRKPFFAETRRWLPVRH
jgi:hypothetical protein